MTALVGTAESEVKWRAWLAKGRAHDLNVFRTARLVTVCLAIAGAIGLTAVLLLR